MFIGATNVIASRPPERRPTETPHARAKITTLDSGPLPPLCKDEEPERCSPPVPCPEEQPDFGSSCSLPDTVCYYGSQTCCGETMAEYRVECGGGKWSGYHVETGCRQGWL